MISIKRYHEQYRAILIISSFCWQLVRLSWPSEPVNPPHFSRIQDFSERFRHRKMPHESIPSWGHGYPQRHLRRARDQDGKTNSATVLRYREIASLQGPSLLKVSSAHSFDIETQSLWIFLSFAFVFDSHRCSAARWNPSTDPHISMRETLRSQKKMAKNPQAVYRIKSFLCSELSAQYWQPLTITSLNYQGTVRPLNYRAERAMGKRCETDWRGLWDGETAFAKALERRILKKANAAARLAIPRIFETFKSFDDATFFGTFFLISTAVQECRR